MLTLASLAIFGLFGLSYDGLGPPLLFATGLCNCMPSQGYSKFLKILQRDFTVFRYDTARPLIRRDVEMICSEINHPFVYVGHSSLAPSLLRHNSISAIVLLDPASFPKCFDHRARRFISRSIEVEKPVLVINAEYTTSGEFPFIPAGFELNIVDSESQSLIDVGHADILDDQYASACHLIGIRGHSPLKDAHAKRHAYRLEVAENIRRFYKG